MNSSHLKFISNHLKNIDLQPPAVSSLSTPSDSGDNINNKIYSSIIQCFTVILSGYICGHAKWITDTQAVGLGRFVSKFALPALLFQNMAILQFSTVNWLFLLSIFIAKSVLFLLVGIVTLILTKPIDFGKCGLYSIFVTQSNDFALGFPLVSSLYQKIHPEFLNYIYLVAPISLILLNPFGFILMEIQRRRNSNLNERTSCFSMFYHVFGSTLSNPIIFMTILGLCANLILLEKLPNVLFEMLKVFGDSFSACALFFLGHGMVGKVKSQNGMKFVVAIILIAIKMLILPIFIREIVTLLKVGQSYNETIDYATYGFLYGTFPTAPTVFIYASQYQIESDLVGFGMVISTFLSAPLMFISGKIITLPISKDIDYNNLISVSSFDVACVGLVCSLWIIIVFIANKRHKSFPHQFTLYLSIFQGIGCMVLIISKWINYKILWQYYIYVLFYSISLFTNRLYVPILTILLFYLSTRSLCFALKKRLHLFIFWLIVPVIFTSITLIFGKRSHKKTLPELTYGNLQLIINVVITGGNLFVVLGCVMAYFRCNNKVTKRNEMNTDDIQQESDVATNQNNNCTIPSQRPLLCSDSSDQPSILNSFEDDEIDEELFNNSTAIIESEKDLLISTTCVKRCKATNCNNCINSTDHDQLQNIEDIVAFPETQRPINQEIINNNDSNTANRQRTITERSCELHQSTCSPEERRTCERLLRTYEKNISDIEGFDIENIYDSCQIVRHIMLIIFLCIPQALCLALDIWRLLSDPKSGAYIELEFLDGVLNYGQGIFTFAVFGFDMHMVVEPFIRRWRKCFHGSEIIKPSWQQLDNMTKRSIQQFTHYHYKTCIQEILTEIERDGTTLQQVFTGRKFVDWLLKVGLAEDRFAGTQYGKRLLKGDLIQHIDAKRDFHDTQCIYRFSNQHCQNENV